VVSREPVGGIALSVFDMSPVHAVKRTNEQDPHWIATAYYAETHMRHNPESFHPLKDTLSVSHAWAFLIMEELARLGLRDVCIAPGSRSTPLVLAAANHDRLQTHVHFDERGLCFLALGLARASGRPVAVVTTSGTAVANLLPALVEAKLTGVPLLVLTADRPPELIDVGANQAIRQPGLL
jgi:hypothetical protein